MRPSWQNIVRYEVSRGTSFGRVVFSRPDLEYRGGFGGWANYPGDWYSAPHRFPDMFWILRRTAAERVLGTTYETFLSCAPGDTCCNMRSAAPSHWATELWYESRILVRHCMLVGCCCYLISS